MRGHIRKRGRTWSIVFDAGLSEDGRRKQQWQGGFPTRKAAEQELARVLRGLQTSEYIAPNNQTLGEFLVDEWLPAIRVGNA